MFSIKFNMDNIAFEENPQKETLRILKGIMRKIEKGQDCGPCIDINGYKCGEWFYYPPEKEQEDEA